MYWELIGIIYMIVIGISIVGMLMWSVFHYKKDEEIYEKKYYYVMNFLNKSDHYIYNEVSKELENI